MEARTEAMQFLESAPQTLRRTNSPAILIADLSKAEPTQFLSDFSEDSKAATNRFKDAVSRGAVNVFQISAKKALEEGLVTPKYTGDDDSKWLWYRDAVGNFWEAVQKLAPHCDKNVFRAWGEYWERKVLDHADSATLWEFGVIAESHSGVSLLTFSNPWDKSRRGWQKRLSPERLFISRAYELDIFTEQIADKTSGRLRLDSAFNADDLQVWWGEATRYNKIYRDWDKYLEARKKTRTFSERVLPEIFSDDRVARNLKDSTKMFGYLIQGNSGVFPGSVDYRVLVDNGNWLNDRSIYSQSQ